MLAFVFLLGSALASCVTNPYFFMTGTLPPLTEPATAATTSKLCPTTHVAGADSCCTSKYLDQALDNSKMLAASIETLYDTINLILVNGKLINSAISTYAGSPSVCLEPDLNELPDATAGVLYQTNTILLQNSGSGLSAIAEKHWKALRPMMQDIARRTADLYHGMVCESCRPSHVAAFDTPAVGEEADIQTIFTQIMHYMKQDDFSAIRDTLAKHHFEKQMGELHTDFATLLSKKSVHDAVSRAIKVCKVDSSKVQMDVIDLTFANYRMMVQASPISKIFVKVFGDLAGQESLTAVNTIMNNIVRPLAELGCTKPKQLHDAYLVAKRFTTECKDIPAAIRQVMSGQPITVKSCVLTPQDIIVAAPLVALFQAEPYYKSSDVAAYVKSQGGAYSVEDLKHLRTGPGAGDRNVDMFRLAKSIPTRSDDADTSIMTVPTSMVSRKTDPHIDDKDMPFFYESVNYDTAHYATAVSPVQVAAKSEISFSKDMVFSGSLGISALAGLVAVLLAALI